MAHKKAGGSSRNGRDSAGRRLGVKKFGGEHVILGNIPIRQRGTKWWPGGASVWAVTIRFSPLKGQGHVPQGPEGRTFVSVCLKRRLLSNSLPMTMNAGGSAACRSPVERQPMDHELRQPHGCDPSPRYRRDANGWLTLRRLPVGCGAIVAGWAITTCRNGCPWFHFIPRMMQDSSLRPPRHSAG